MASAAQVIANRANAAHSTGPRTHEGKARCASNALRQGLTAARLVVRDDEREEFETFRADLAGELAPQGPVETTIFHDLLHAAWNLQRFRRIEAECAPDPADEAAAAFLDRLGRYQARAQRAFYRALRELRMVQTNRALRAIKLTEEEDASVPAIADINEMTKQSQSEVTAEALELAIKMIDYQTGSFRLQAIAKARGRADASAAVPASGARPSAG